MSGRANDGGNIMNVENIINMESKIEKFLRWNEEHKELPLMLFGAGAAVRWYIDFAYKYGLIIECIIDGKVESGEVDYIEGIAVKNTEDIFEEYENANIIISAPKYRKEIETNIKKQRPLYNVFSFDPTLRVLQSVTECERKKFFGDNRNKIEYLESILEDDYSRKTLEYVIQGSITGNCDCYSNISSDSQYFPDFIMERISGVEVFVDIGAYIGDTLNDFQQIKNNHFKRYYAFEPDSENYNIMHNNYIFDDRILIYMKGVGKENEYLFFRNEKNTDVSHIVQDQEHATSKIEIVRMDDILEEKIDFVKMDIEGMELEALGGGEKLIKRYKPILAISIYHKLEDIIEIPQYIMDLGLGYKLYLRHYWDCNGTDTILFAV